MRRLRLDDLGNSNSDTQMHTIVFQIPHFYSPHDGAVLFFSGKTKEKKTKQNKTDKQKNLPTSFGFHKTQNWYVSLLQFRPSKSGSFLYPVLMKKNAKIDKKIKKFQKKDGNTLYTTP